MITFGVRYFPFSDPWLIRLPIYRGSKSATSTNHTSNKMCLWVDVCIFKEAGKGDIFFDELLYVLLIKTR